MFTSVNPSFNKYEEYYTIVYELIKSTIVYDTYVEDLYKYLSSELHTTEHMIDLFTMCIVQVTLLHSINGNIVHFITDPMILHYQGDSSIYQVIVYASTKITSKIPLFNDISKTPQWNVFQSKLKKLKLTYIDMNTVITSTSV